MCINRIAHFYGMVKRSESTLLGRYWHYENNIVNLGYKWINEDPVFSESLYKELQKKCHRATFY